MRSRLRRRGTGGRRRWRPKPLGSVGAGGFPPRARRAGRSVKLAAGDVFGAQLRRAAIHDARNLVRRDRRDVAPRRRRRRRAGERQGEDRRRLRDRERRRDHRRRSAPVDAHLGRGELEAGARHARLGPRRTCRRAAGGRAPGDAGGGGGREARIEEICETRAPSSRPQTIRERRPALRGGSHRTTWPARGRPWLTG